jgi:SDR family mycofactocin-dependent oxidoreductase
MGKLDGKVVLVTGAARGLGRAHSLACAEEGADIIALDLCARVPSVEYPSPARQDLEEVGMLVEKIGRSVFTAEVDTRDVGGLRSAISAGVRQLGRLDCVIANAGILNITSDRAWGAAAWQETIDVNLTGTFDTLDACMPVLLAQGTGGSVTVTSSIAGVKAFVTEASLASSGYMAYTASKHALIGLVKAYALIGAPHKVRVNAILPTGVNTPMCVNDFVGPYMQKHSAAIAMHNALPVEVIEPEDVANAALWLLSDDARYVTGIELRVDAGCSLR